MWIKALALAALAALINLAAPTVFFDSQLMLGSGVAVLALLLFGWPALVVGASALAVTVWRWGHPYELLIGLGFLIWLGWWLQRRGVGGRWPRADRIVLAAIGYWLLLGLPAEVLLFRLRMGVGLEMAFGLGLKEAVTAVLSTTLALLLYQLWMLVARRGRPGQLSARGATFAAVLLAACLPGVLITFVLSAQLKATALEAQELELDTVASLVRPQRSPQTQRLPSGVEARWVDPQGGPALSTDPLLFARLDRDFAPESPSRTGLPGLQILMPRRPMPVLRADQQAYWLVQRGGVEVVQPAEPLIRRLDYDLKLPAFSLLGLLLVAAALLAEGLAVAVDRQFLQVIRPLQRQSDAAAPVSLGGSAIRELQSLVELVNSRSRRVQELSASLQQARDQLAETALAITEAIPVGTYTMVLRPGAQLAQFVFMSERFLEICGLERQAARADALQAFACVHPDDHDAWLALNAETFARKLPFKGQCRVLVKGEVRWIQAESVPRDLADGSTVWEGVIADVTEQVQAQAQLREREQELRRILDTLPIPVGCNRLDAAYSVVFINRCFLDTFGYGPEEVTNLESWGVRAYPDPAYRQEVFSQWDAAVREARNSGEPVRPLQLQVVCQDGSRREVILTAAIVGELMVAGFLDLTERLRAEAALERAYRREAELKDQQRRELESKLRTSLTAAAVAHEINQPLSSILINAQLLQGQLAVQPPGPVRAALEPLLAVQVAEAQRIEVTIEKMRMLLRNVQTDLQRLDLTEVVNSALLYTGSLRQRQGVALDAGGLDQPCWVEGDGAQLQIAVVNLIRNAVEALGQAGVADPRLHLQITAAAGADGSPGLELALHDNGPGFGDLDLSQLPLTTTKPAGSGIGLYVARTTAENHGGSLEIGRSADLGGAVVRLRLPACA